MLYFTNRAEAGRKLAEFFDHINGKNAVVYALPRGGVVVAAEIARSIHAPLDLIITRKIGHPFQPEYAIGAVAENGHSVLSKEVSNIDQQYLKKETEKQKQEAKRRREVYLEGRKPISSKGKTAILVDDGVATGFTIKTAIIELKAHYYPQRVIIAVPIIPKNISDELKNMDVEVLAILTTKDFLGSVGSYYQDFPPVNDKEVISFLK